MAEPIKKTKQDNILINKGVAENELPKGEYTYVIRDAYKEVLYDIEVQKPLTWGRISKDPESEANFKVLGGNLNDLNDKRAIAQAHPEYSHFLLPKALRDSLTKSSGNKDNEKILTTKDDFYNGPTFWATADKGLKTFENALDTNLDDTLTDMAYNRVSKKYIKDTKTKADKDTIYNSLLASVKEQ